MIYCKRNFHFDTAHRVVGHKGKCQKLHGHRYSITVTFAAEELDELGMVIDFAIIKQIFGSWIDENLDHNTILWIKDKELGEHITALTGQKIYYMQNNTTVENIALHIKNDILPKLFADYPIKIIEVEAFETPNCSVICK